MSNSNDLPSNVTNTKTNTARNILDWRSSTVSEAPENGVFVALEHVTEVPYFLAEELPPDI